MDFLGVANRQLMPLQNLISVPLGMVEAPLLDMRTTPITEMTRSFAKKVRKFFSWKYWEL